MERRFEKFAYFCHDVYFNGTAVMAESFETLADFKEFAKKYNMMVCYCPMNHASVMVKNYEVVTPKQYESRMNLLALKDK
jgi:hypothetical protein